MEKRKVIIVGGGLAGLSAAYELSKLPDFDIHVIEKNNHLGGRVQSCAINGQMIDIGGFLIYPWYKQYHKLIETLGLEEELEKIPPAKDYYVAKKNEQEEYLEGFSLSFKDIVEIFVSVFPNQIIDTDPTEPELNAYDNLSIQDYLNSLNLDTEKVNLYLSVFDTYLQGYCYGSVSLHKMAFMAATLFQNMLHGDMHACSYLRNGSKIFIDAMQAELEKNGVQFHLNCSLESVNGQQLMTSLGTMRADDFIFCNYPAAVPYSKFITATVSYSGIVMIDEDADWGSCFFKDDPKQPYPILSVVNLEKLYTEKTANHLNLNIKVNQEQHIPISNADLLAIIRTEIQTHFKDITILELKNRIDWEKAMPIATEEEVEALITKQGQQHVYYAGDYMGCPAMETALMSGKRAAERLIKDLTTD